MGMGCENTWCFNKRMIIVMKRLYEHQSERVRTL